MRRAAVDGESERPRAERIADRPLHIADLCRCRGTLIGRLAHCVLPYGILADQAADVHADSALEVTQVLPERLPPPGNTRLEHRARHSLDADEILNRGITVFGSAGSQGETTVAHDDARHAVEAQRGCQRVPADLGVHVRVVVDEAGGDDETIGVQGAPRRPVHLADRDDPVAGDSHVTGVSRHARAIDDPAVLNHQVVGHQRRSSSHAASDDSLRADAIGREPRTMAHITE